MISRNSADLGPSYTKDTMVDNGEFLLAMGEISKQNGG